MGTLVRDGHGSGIVVATAGQTVFGSVFEMMSDIEKPKPHCNKQWINWGRTCRFSVLLLLV